MYKGASRFGQYLRESNQSATEPLKLPKLSKSDKSRMSNSATPLSTAFIKAKQEREISEAGITPSFITAIGPLVSSLNLKGGALAVALNKRGIKPPNGGDWTKRLANYVRSQALKS